MYKFLLVVASLLFLPSSGRAQDYDHKDYELFKLALDIRQENKLDIFSHSLSFSSELSEGLVSSTLVLPGKVGGSFEITSKSLFIYIDPEMVNYFSKNDWAFMIGHEFAHLLNANTDLNSIELEKKCDIEGAKYAMGAGYDLESYLVTLGKFGDNCSSSHGCMEERIKTLRNEFGKEG